MISGGVQTGLFHLEGGANSQYAARENHDSTAPRGGCPTADVPNLPVGMPFSNSGLNSR